MYCYVVYDLVGQLFYKFCTFLKNEENQNPSSHIEGIKALVDIVGTKN